MFVILATTVHNHGLVLIVEVAQRAELAEGTPGKLDTVAPGAA